jgi:hypothetical protein
MLSAGFEVSNLKSTVDAAPTPSTKFGLLE